MYHFWVSGLAFRPLCVKATTLSNTPTRICWHDFELVNSTVSSQVGHEQMNNNKKQTVQEDTRASSRNREPRTIRKKKNKSGKGDKKTIRTTWLLFVFCLRKRRQVWAIGMKGKAVEHHPVCLERFFSLNKDVYCSLWTNSKQLERIPPTAIITVINRARCLPKNKDTSKPL